VFTPITIHFTTKYFNVDTCPIIYLFITEFIYSFLSGRRQTHTAFWCSNVKETNHLEDLEVDKNTILKWMLKKDGRAWIGFIWLRIRRSEGLL